MFWLLLIGFWKLSGNIFWISKIKPITIYPPKHIEPSGCERIYGTDLSPETIAFTSVGHLMPAALPLITKLIVFTQHNYLEIVANLPPGGVCFGQT